jgi:hypothetical protein
MSTMNLVYIAKVTHRVLIQCKWHHSRPKPEIDHFNSSLQNNIILILGFILLEINNKLSRIYFMT